MADQSRVQNGAQCEAKIGACSRIRSRISKSGLKAGKTGGAAVRQGALIPTFLILLSFLCLNLFGCSKSDWKGYEKEDLSKYISLGEYRGLTYKSVSADVSEEEIAKKIDELTKEHSYEAVITDRKAEKGDTALISVICRIDGEEFSELSSAEKKLVLGKPAEYEWENEIAARLIGMQPGNSFEYEFKFTPDFIMPSLSNPQALMAKTAVFYVTFTGIAEERTPAANDDFARSLGYNSLADMKEKLESELKKEKAEQALLDEKNELWQKAVNSAEVLSLPEAEVEKYATEMKTTWEYYAEQNNYYSLEYFLQVTYNKSIESFEADAKKYAEQTVKQLLVLYSIARAEGIGVTGDEYDRYIDEILSSEKNPDVKTEEDLEQYYGRSTLVQTALWNKVTDLLLSSGTAS